MSLSPGSEQASLWRKVRQAETALRIDAWLAAPDGHRPGDIGPSTTTNRKGRNKPSHGSVS